MTMICLNVCPNCGQYMYEHRCCAICPRCGVFYDSEDLFFYDEVVTTDGVRMTVFPNQLANEEPRAQA